MAQTVKEALQTRNIEMPTEIYTLLIKDVPEALKQENGSSSHFSKDATSQQGTITEV